MLPPFKKNILPMNPKLNRASTFSLFSHKQKDAPAPRIIIEEMIEKTIMWAFFDGASQDNKSGGMTTYNKKVIC